MLHDGLHTNNYSGMGEARVGVCKEEENISICITELFKLTTAFDAMQLRHMKLKSSHLTMIFLGMSKILTIFFFS